MTHPRIGRLTLTRKVGQGFTIGSDVQVTIKVVTGRHVMLEIAAPHDRRILRTELAPFPGTGTEG
jgi:carbon storage regulator CsrA